MMDALIERVKSRPILYNSNFAGYKDNAARAEAWKEIATELNMSPDECRRQWTNLRNSFTNAIKRRHYKYAQTGRKLGAWTYEDQMAFLLPYIETANGVYLYMPQTDVHNLPDEIVNQFEEMEDPQCAGYFGERKPKKMKRTSSCYGEEVKNAPENRQFTTLRREMSETKLTDLDDSDMFYLSMSKTIKRLPQSDRARIRLELCRLVSEAEMKQVTGYQG